MKKTSKYYTSFITLLFLLLSIAGYGQLSKSYLINQSRYFLGKDQFTESITILNQLVKIDSTLDEAWFLRGVAKYYLNDLQGARSDLNMSIKYNPVSSQAYLYRAIVLSRLSRYSAAISDYDMAIDLRPSFGIAYFNRGIAYLLTMNPKKAIIDFSQAIKLDPKNADALINRGIAKAMDSDTLGALTDLRQAVLLNPFYSESYSRRGRLYFELGDFNLALSDFNKAIECDSSISINYFYRSLVYSEFKKPLDAIKDLNRTIFLNPDNALSLYNRGLVYWQVGNTKEALVDFNRVSELNPDNILIYYNRGVLLFEQKNYVDAISDFSLAIGLFPDFANAYIGRSAAYSLLGKQVEAQKDHLFAQSIAERYKNNHSQPWTDTTNKFKDLLAFSSDFSPKTTITNLENINSHSIDIKPFARIMLVPAALQTYFDQSIEWVNSINDLLALCSYKVTLCTSEDFLGINLENVPVENTLLTQITRANNLTSQGKYREAIEIYNGFMADEPNNPAILLNLAATQADMTNYIASFEKELVSINLDQSSRNNLKSSGGGFLNFSYEESLETLDLIDNILPNHFAVEYNKGNIYSLSGELENALWSYTKSIEQKPDFAEGWYNRALVYLMLHENEKACYDLSIAGEKGIKQAYLLINRFCRP